MLRAFLLLVFALVSSSALAFKGTVEWTAVSTSGLVKIHGTGGIAKGSIEEGFTCDMWDFDTDNDTRNKHMREKYLEVEKFPKAKLVLDRTVKPSEAFDWSGQLTIKKETKPVKGKATIKDGVLTATFTISLADYPSIGVPSWLGVTVAKNVEVTVKGPEK